MKKTNKLISILLVVAMLLSMAPLSLTASAALTPTATGGCDGSHSEYTALSQSGWSLKITQPGNYYINKDWAMETYEPTLVIKCSGTVTVCLNGYDLYHTGNSSRVVYIYATGGDLTVNLCDCKGTGEIYHNNKQTGIDLFGDKSNGYYATLNMYGGTIRDCSSGISESGNTRFNMYGGTIKGCSYYGVFQSSSDGKVNIYGGSIINNSEGIRVCSADAVTLTGSPVITGNTNGDLYFRINNSPVIAKNLSVNEKITIAQYTAKDCAVVKVDSEDAYDYFEALDPTARTISHNDNTIWFHGDHLWKDANCTEPKTCQSCGMTEGTADATAHSWANNDGVCANGCGYECPHENQTGANCEICGKSLHTHSFTYTASGDTITSVCENTDGNCTDTNGGYLTIFAPADLYVDGSAKEATVENNLVDTSVVIGDITYSTADGSAPVTAGTYTASVTVGGATASVQFTLLNYAAKVTDKNGNLVGNYKTLDEAIAAAQASEGSTLTLLDDITLTSMFEIASGKFILDLNGKTIINPDGIEIGSSAELTIVDSASGGKISGNMFGIFNDGSLTVNGGIIEASCAVYNYGTVTVDNGNIQGYITNNGALIVNGGTLTRIKNPNTSYTATVEINGGTFTDFNTIENNDGDIIVKGGIYPNGFSITNDGNLECTANSILADGYHYRDADGKLITVADDAKAISGYVKVTKGADLADAVITLDKTEFTYSGNAIKPTVTVTVGGKTLTEGTDYTLAFMNNANAGAATVTFTGAGDYTGEVEKEFVIRPATVDIVWEGDEFYYTGNLHAVTAKYVDVNGNEIDVTSITNGTNTDVGTYIATAVVEDTNYTVNGATINHSYEIKWYDGAPDATVIGTMGENGWYTSIVTVKAPEGYAISTTVDGTYGNEITFENEENAVCYLKQADTGYIAKSELGEIKTDLENPTAEITVGENKWNTFLNTVTFGKFFKETQTVTITADDETSGVAKLEYIVAIEEISDFENAEWTEYTEEINIEPNSKNIIYARATDTSGRQIIVNSDGIVLYTDSTLDTSVKDEIIYVLTKNAAQSFTLNLNGNTVSYVKIDETVLGTDDYEVLSDMIIISAEVLENLAAGEYTITVGINPMGETFAEGDAPAEVTIPLTVKKADVAIEITISDKVYDGKPITADYEISKSSDGSPAASNIDYNETVEFKVKGVDDSTYTTDVPVNAGEYTVRITVTETDKINSAQATADFTIAKKAVTVTATAPDKVYDGTINLDFSKVTITFDGIVDGDDVDYEILDGSYFDANVGKKRVFLSYDVSGKDADNYDFRGEGVYIPESDYTVMTTANITAKDISDAFIILGDTLTYNGTEQTQTVTAVEIPADLDVTYTVSGNKATNVGVYLLTVTGTGNFSGEAKVAYEIAPDTTGIDALTAENVTSADKAAVEAVKAQIDNAVTDLAGDEKKAEYKAIADKCDELLKKIDDIATEIERIEEAVNGYDETTVKSTDKADLEQLKADIKALTDGKNITDDERAKLAELDKKIDALIKKIADTAVEIARIDEAVNGYDEETVKSSDEEVINKLKDDIQTLIDSGNITDEERAVLEETKADADALTDKIDETQAEIDRINDAVDSYTEDTVKSTDEEAINQLKEDIQALIDSDNTTENEKTVLGEMIEKVNALEDKIEEIENQLEEIRGIENGYNPETVTSDDKADIEAAIAEIEAVNPDNLTDEQKTEYEEIKSEFEALLNEIEAAEKSVADIGVELEMFDENRVTIFWEDDIEALKAKIDELLADENMGEAEETKLNEYKAQADKLIEIINTPKAYFSMRLFYFVWDALHWLSSHVVFIFNWIF